MKKNGIRSLKRQINQLDADIANKKLQITQHLGEIKDDFHSKPVIISGLVSSFIVGFLMFQKHKKKIKNVGNPPQPSTSKKIRLLKILDLLLLVAGLTSYLPLSQKNKFRHLLDAFLNKKNS